MRRSKEVIISKRVNGIIVIIMIILGFYIITTGYDLYVPQNAKSTVSDITNDIKGKISEKLLVKSIPLINYTYDMEEKSMKNTEMRKYETSYFNTFLSKLIPIVDYVMVYDTSSYYTAAEIYPQILMAKEDTTVDELEKLKPLPEDSDELLINIADEDPIKYTTEQLSNIDFVINNFYIPDGVKLTKDDVKVDEFMEKDFSIDLKADEPKILIYHTHGSSEAFVDSREGVTEDSIIGVGAELAKILEEDYGINVIHDQTVYDYRNGKQDRSKAYVYAGQEIATILEENPSIEVVIDLHRDGVGNKDIERVVVIDGERTAQIMFFQGLCKILQNGEMVPVGYDNPYVQDNMAFSFQLKLEADNLYPGWARKIYVKPLRYNMHYMPRSMLVELGCENNTVQEAKNAMKPLAEILYNVLDD